MSILGMFARHPVPGKTKTRLAAGTGETAAAELYANFVQDLVPRTARLADQIWIAITPDTDASRNWFRKFCDSDSDVDCRLLAQPQGSLGDRITWFFRTAAAQGRGPAVLIGTDSPDLPSSRITQAFQVLNDGRADMVTVPAADGGYVLIGLAGEPDALFDNIRWSSPFTLLDTISAAKATGMRLSVLSPWYDIDLLENLGTLLSLQKWPGLTEAAACPHTTRFLERLLPDIADVCDR
ncbi:MAG: TIGR04282 family arsenosugar biosynthesis glycosyltransferase [Fuerstiella sp.]|nr:TIGR04282 family arsenosugar biosynthesis glycosyltransferase [Fuerstiella sp.]